MRRFDRAESAEADKTPDDPHTCSARDVTPGKGLGDRAAGIEPDKPTPGVGRHDAPGCKRGCDRGAAAVLSDEAADKAQGAAANIAVCRRARNRAEIAADESARK